MYADGERRYKQSIEAILIKRICRYILSFRLLELCLVFVNLDKVRGFLFILLINSNPNQ